MPGRTGLAIGVLSLVIAPDRASTSVGDFTEESTDRGSVWFWRQIAATFIAHVGSDFASAPCRLLLCIPLGLAIFLVEYVLLLLFSFRILLPSASSHFSPIEQILPVVLLLWVIFLSVGHALASFSGKPVASALVFIAMLEVWNIYAAPKTAAVQHVSLPGVPEHGVPEALVLIGAIDQRRRTLRSA